MQCKLLSYCDSIVPTTTTVLPITISLLFIVWERGLCILKALAFLLKVLRNELPKRKILYSVNQLSKSLKLLCKSVWTKYQWRHYPVVLDTAGISRIDDVDKCHRLWQIVQEFCRHFVTLSHTRRVHDRRMFLVKVSLS